MKIGILTFHKSINNGAVIQCFSLANKLKKELVNHEVEVIDYHMPKAVDFYSDSLVDYLKSKSVVVFLKKTVKLILDPKKLMRYKARRKAFESVNTVLPLSEKSIIDNDTEKLFKYINDTYDAVIVGSDAVWNYNLRGFPNPYFLSEDIKCKKFTYAASCYGMSYENINQHEKTEIKKALDTYEFLGVRDDESAKFVKFIGCNKDTVHTCDPTVFLDLDILPIDEAVIKVKLSKKGFDFNKETIAVMGSGQMHKMVRRIYGKKYQIVALYEYSKYADVNLHDLTPYEWAYVFKYFKLTFTTYFHGTLLSLRNGVPVVCVALETEYSKNHMTKVNDFLIRIGMEDCYFHTDYTNVHDDKIKNKADALLNGDWYEIIKNKMDNEALCIKPFVEALKKFTTDNK